jgi:maltose O-acetyltransferase
MSDWLFALGLNMMNLLPGKGRALSLRGRWASRFLATSGENLKLSGQVNVYYPERLHCGDHVYIGYGTYIGGGDVFLDDQVVIGPYCCIVAGNHTMKDESYRFGPYASGTIRIGRGSWLGAHVTVTSGVTIGRGCLIAANSVVTRDVPDLAILGGVPAKPIVRIPGNHGAS